MSILLNVSKASISFDHFLVQFKRRPSSLAVLVHLQEMARRLIISVNNFKVFETLYVLNIAIFFLRLPSICRGTHSVLTLGFSLFINCFSKCSLGRPYHLLSFFNKWVLCDLKVIDAEFLINGSLTLIQLVKFFYIQY